MNRSVFCLVVLFAMSGAAFADSLFGSVGRGGSPNPGAILLIDDSTGLGLLLGDPTPGTVGISGLVFTGDGRLWASSIDGSGSTSRLLELDPLTGALLADVGDLAAPNVVNIPQSIGDLAWDPTTDTLYGMGSGANGPGIAGFIVSINRSTGVLIDIWGPMPALQPNFYPGGGIAIAGDGTFYAVGVRPGSFDAVLYKVVLNKPNLTLTEVAALPTFFDGLAVRPSDGMIFGVPGGFVGASTLYSIDPISGTVLAVGGPLAQGWKVSDLAFSTPVPEPSSLLLALFGVSMLGLSPRLRRRLSRRTPPRA